MRELAGAESRASATSVIFVFLTGGPVPAGQLRSQTRGHRHRARRVQADRHEDAGRPICEHLPMLAERSNQVAAGPLGGRTRSDGHEIACHMLLTGRLDLPAGFTRMGRQPNEWPSIPADRANYASRAQQPAAGDCAAQAKHQRGGGGPSRAICRPARDRGDAWHLELAAKCPLGNGACPECFRLRRLRLPSCGRNHPRDAQARRCPKGRLDGCASRSDYWRERSSRQPAA